MINFSRFYQTFIRTKLFNKIILIYSILMIIIFLTLAILIYEYSTHSLLQKEISMQTEAVNSITRYLDHKQDQSKETVLQLYLDQTLSEDLLYFLRNDIQHYVQHRLETYLSSNSIVSRDMITFFKNQINNDEDILNISLYSPEQSTLTVYQKFHTQYIELRENKVEIAQTIENMLLNKEASPRSPQLDKLLNIQQPDAYTFTYEIKDPNTLHPAGTLMITYQTKGIEKVLTTSFQNLKGTHFVLFPNGQMLYDSSRRYEGQMYPYFRQLLSSKGYVKLDVNSYTAISKTDKSALIAVGIVPVAEIETSNVSFKRRIIAITSSCFLFTIIFAYMAVFRYARRIRAIIQTMKLARQGNLTVRIPVHNDDELDEISLSFNRMCEDLTSYINQVYVSEIKQKHAELVAFQAQINPHFLYNTLEAIRMRAIAQGATDVGEMIYSLGSLFQYTVKQETIVTLEKEIENCRRFLELYRIRYKYKFDYRIEIDPKLKECPVLKLTVQPLIENIIVHGIRQSSSTNMISIMAFLDEDTSTLRIVVEDNGKGIEPEKLLAIQESFKETETPFSSTSLGLRNVNERIRLQYGESYGLSIESELQERTVVCLRIPFQKTGVKHNV